MILCCSKPDFHSRYHQSVRQSPQMQQVGGKVPSCKPVDRPRLSKAMVRDLPDDQPVAQIDWSGTFNPLLGKPHAGRSRMPGGPRRRQTAWIFSNGRTPKDVADLAGGKLMGCRPCSLLMQGYPDVTSIQWGTLASSDKADIIVACFHEKSPSPTFGHRECGMCWTVRVVNHEIKTRTQIEQRSRDTGKLNLRQCLGFRMPEVGPAQGRSHETANNS